MGAKKLVKLFLGAFGKVTKGLSQLQRWPWFWAPLLRPWCKAGHLWPWGRTQQLHLCYVLTGIGGLHSIVFSHFRCVQLCNPMDCSSLGFSVCGFLQARIPGMGCHALLQGTFPTQELNPNLLHLLHRRQILYRWATRETQRPPLLTAYLLSDISLGLVPLPIFLPLVVAPSFS